MSSNNFTRFGIGTPQDEYQTLNMVVEELLASYKQEQDFAASIQDQIVDDVVSPVTGKKFGETYMLDTNKDGHPMITLFPWNEKDSASRNSVASINAFIDAFGLIRYARRLEVSDHIRSFDPVSPFEEDVRSFQNGLTGDWLFQDWKDGRLVFSKTRDQTRRRRRYAKHTELNMQLRALQGGFKFHIVLLNERAVNNWERKQERFSGTVADALKAKGEDWAMAQAAASLRRQANGEAVDISKGVMVGGIDLTKITKPRKVQYTTPRSVLPITITLQPAQKQVFRAKLEEIAYGLSLPNNSYTLLDEETN